MDAPQRFSPLVPKKNDDDIAGHLHRQAIGLLGATLPIWIYVLDRERPSSLLAPGDLTSISAYYWSSGVIAFSGVLAAIAAYLVAYDGYNTKDGWKDWLGSTLAGLAAALVVIFPTSPPSDAVRPVWWRDWIGEVHYYAAVAFFLAFVYFCWFRFTKSGVGGFAWSTASRDDWDTEKRVRNALYVVCGVGVLVSMYLAWRAAKRDDPIFWQEVAALELFALAWLAKGRADQTALRAAQRGAFSARHPVKAAKRVAAWGKRTLEGEGRVPPSGTPAS